MHRLNVIHNKLLFVTISLVIAFTNAGRRSNNNRDTDSLTFRRKSPEFNAAYRRAADMTVKNRIPLGDQCYDMKGKAKKCNVYEFGNIALMKQVESTSTCGTPPNRYCNRVASPVGGDMRQCYICDANHIERRNPASNLIDSNQKSCWVSQTFENSSVINEVTVKISLGKKYELTYIIIPFCNKLPESMALYKSADFGRKWVPLQYYSSDCKGMYNMKEDGIILRSNEQAAVCKNIYSGEDPYKQTRLAFSLVAGRPSAHNLANSPVLRDWVTVTDIKVVFKRLRSPKELSTETEGNYYSMSEITLGGRCKCNGHGSRCITDSTGNTRCECQHNTAGADCDRCKDFYFNRPWRLATTENANECVACNCYLHSKRCVFNNDLYLLSGKISGGVCIKCRHNTAGNNCHYCKEGYYRDNKKSLSNRKVCKHCNCHPYGSRGKSCNDDGKCNCKEGVTGLKCDRCKPGFSMTKTITSPCQKNPMRTRDTPPTPPKQKSCGSCRSLSNKLDLRKYCNSAFAIKALVKDRKNIGNGWIRFGIIIQYVYKKGAGTRSARRVRRDNKYVYVQESDLHCKCPKLRLNKTYIMIGATKKSGSKDGLSLDRQSIVFRYNPDYDKRVKYYKKEDRRRGCRAFL